MYYELHHVWTFSWHTLWKTIIHWEWTESMLYYQEQRRDFPMDWIFNFCLKGTEISTNTLIHHGNKSQVTIAIHLNLALAVWTKTVSTVRRLLLKFNSNEHGEHDPCIFLWNQLSEFNLMCLHLISQTWVIYLWHLQFQYSTRRKWRLMAISVAGCKNGRLMKMAGLLIMVTSHEYHNTKLTCTD